MASSKDVPRSHASQRTVEQWVKWAEGEGLTDIVEKDPTPEAQSKPGVVGGMNCISRPLQP